MFHCCLAVFDGCKELLFLSRTVPMVDWFVKSSRHPRSYVVVTLAMLLRFINCRLNIIIIIIIVLSVTVWHEASAKDSACDTATSISVPYAISCPNSVMPESKAVITVRNMDRVAFDFKVISGGDAAEGAEIETPKASTVMGLGLWYNNNNNNHDDIYSAVIYGASHMRGFTVVHLGQSRSAPSCKLDP